MSESALPMALFEVTKGPQRENRAGLDPPVHPRPGRLEPISAWWAPGIKRAAADLVAACPSGSEVGEEHLAVDPPALALPDEHEEVGVPRAAPVERLQSCHGGAAGVVDRHDACL